VFCGAQAFAEWETVGIERPANCFAEDPFSSRPQGVLAIGPSRLCRNPATFIPRQSNAKVSDRCLETDSNHDASPTLSNVARATRLAPVHSTDWFDDDAVRHRFPDHSRI
jgi:hypothetical protein